MTEQFRHEALLYAGDDEFVTGTLSFVASAVEAGDPVLVATSAEKIALLRENLNGQSENVQFADMQKIGVNPGAIISAWREFVSGRAPGRAIWGIGEPVWPGRSAAELAECHHHECLLNLAFADTPAFRLLCPYDIAVLDPGVIEAAHISHPVIVRDGARRASKRYGGLPRIEEVLGGSLPEPEVPTRELAFVMETLAELRRLVLESGRQAGLPDGLVDDLVLAVNELATNSVRHAGGSGTVRVWREPGTIVWEVSDPGRISDPLAGRQRPPRDDEGGYGLWMVNQLCELVQVRSTDNGTVVRLHVRVA